MTSDPSRLAAPQAARPAAAGRPVGISLGDPAGIGPEIVAHALAERPDAPLLVFGDAAILEAAASAMRVPRPDPRRIRTITVAPAPSTPWPRGGFEGGPEGGDAGGDARIRPGQPNLGSAFAQMAYLDAATRAALSGEIRALCTAPISKTWIARTGFRFPGHTEYLASRSGTTDFAMMLAGPRLRIVLATTHLPLREVPLRLTPEDVARAAVLAAHALVDKFGIGRARVAVAGLNPHAGESGRFGDEETRIVEPGIAQARARLSARAWPAVISGPYPPDAVFRAAALGEFDAVVALYHDQGLIPVKLLHFDEAVNITLGLPFVRTSPDHGTAYSLAGTGRANPASFLAALDLALRLS